MQKVNTAYAKKDLLTLLSLQLEAEQIDQTHLNNISEDRLKSFNKILKEQLSEVQTEINRVVYPLMHQFGPFGFNLSNPGILQKELQKEIVQIKADTSRIKGDLALFENPSNLKAWLKRYRIPSAPDFLFDDF